MRLRPLIGPPIAMSFLLILTGCHLSHMPSPALSMATMALSAAGILGTYLLMGTKRRRSMNFPGTR
jgi:hypothetical protein